MTMSNIKRMKDLMEEFPRFFLCEGKFSVRNFVKSLVVCNKEIDWKVPVGEIPLNNSGVVYDVGAVIATEAHIMVDKLVAEGAILKLRIEDKGYFSLVMFF